MTGSQNCAVSALLEATQSGGYLLRTKIRGGH